MKTIIGIDVGTSSIKAVLFKENGEALCTARRESRLISNTHDQMELDMMEVWENVVSCLRELSGETPEGVRSVVAIGVTGQGEGFWGIDEQGEPVRNAILWCDGRAIEDVEAITKENPEIGDFYYKTTGTHPLPGNQMMILHWMAHREPEVLQKTKHVLFCKDWVRYKLTGHIETELTDALTSLVDVKTETISDELLNKLGLSEYRALLSDPVRSTQIAGNITKEAAELTGIPEGIPVIAGALDTSATAVGVGAVHEKDVCVILGTTCAGEIVLRKEDCDFGAPNSRFEKHPIGDLYVELQPALNGTPNIDWMLEVLSPTRDFNEIDRIVDAAPVGCGGVIYHPYLSVAGERSPFYHPYARASFFGISQVTKRGDLIRAVYEGLSLSIRDCLQNVDRDGVLYLAGGGAKSPVWAQMIADVVGMKVRIPNEKELGAKGVFIMTAVAMGIYPDYEEAVQATCTFREEHLPDPLRAQKYDMIYELYRKIRINNQEMWNERHLLNRRIREMNEKNEG